MGNGTLISFEGPEGAGKSSILEAVLPLLEEKEIPYITTREPGGVDIAEKIRQVILDPDHTSMDAKTELLLYIGRTCFASPCSWEDCLDGPLY